MAKGQFVGLLRILLALSVALSHIGGPLGQSLAGGMAAVQVFYIISGFYMATILTEKYDPRRDIGVFFSNRILRIYSIYFLCLLISLAGYGVIYLCGHGGWFALIAQAAPMMTWAAKAWLIVVGLVIFGQETTLYTKLNTENHVVFTPELPRAGPLPLWQIMPVPQAWSISLELMFYCLVPFLIRNRTRTLVIIVAMTMALRVAIYHAGFESDPWMSRFFPLELGMFVLGMVARRIYDTRIEKIGPNTQFAVAGLFLAATCVLYSMTLFAMTHGYTLEHVIWPYYFSALIALPCLFQLTRNSKLDRFIGNFSYPLYMIHWIVIKFYEAIAERFHWPGPETWGKKLRGSQPVPVMADHDRHRGARGSISAATGQNFSYRDRALTNGDFRKQ